MAYASRVRFFNGLVCWAIMPKYGAWPVGATPIWRRIV